MINENGSVLLVDDDPAYTPFVEEALRGCPQRPVLHVLDKGTELLTWLAANPAPSLILLDARRLPVNGFNILARLKAVAPYRAIPVVMLMKVGNRGAVRRAYRLGASACIIKPGSVEALRDRLERLSCFWLAPDQGAYAKSAPIRQEFERHLSQYRRAAYEGIQQWQDQQQALAVTDRSADPGAAAGKIWRIRSD